MNDREENLRYHIKSQIDYISGTVVFIMNQPVLQQFVPLISTFNPYLNCNSNDNPQFRHNDNNKTPVIPFT